MRGQLTNRVLLVDDEPLIRKLVSRYLVAAGYVVRLADDGLDAIGKLRMGLPDLIISDLKMPRMSGLEFLDVVRKRLPQIPVIAISCVAPEEIPAGVAADAYYYKDGSGFEQLLQTIADLISKPPARKPAQSIDTKPVKAKWRSDGSYLVGCEDCLREFGVPRDHNLGLNESWTHCVHCGKVVQFLAAEAGSGL